MKIVLRQDVPKVGEAGTVQTVSDGYARNYLIPRGFAVAATKGELKVAEHNLAVKARKVAKQEQQLQSLADRIDGQRLEFTARAGRQGRLYGSITAGDIAERLSAVVREEIDRRKVVLDESIRTVGEHAVAIHLVGRLRPHVVVIVNGEIDEAEEAAEAEVAKAEGAVAEAAVAGAAVAEAAVAEAAEREDAADAEPTVDAELTVEAEPSAADDA